MEQKVVITDVDIPFKRLFMLILKINLAVLAFALPLGLIVILAINGLTFDGALGLLIGLLVVVFLTLFFLDQEK